MRGLPYKVEMYLCVLWFRVGVFECYGEGYLDFGLIFVMWWGSLCVGNRHFHLIPSCWVKLLVGSEGLNVLPLIASVWMMNLSKKLLEKLSRNWSCLRVPHFRIGFLVQLGNFVRIWGICFSNFLLFSEQRSLSVVVVARCIVYMISGLICSIVHGSKSWNWLGFSSLLLW